MFDDDQRPSRRAATFAITGIVAISAALIIPLAIARSGARKSTNVTLTSPVPHRGGVSPADLLGRNLARSNPVSGSSGSASTGFQAKQPKPEQPQHVDENLAIDSLAAFGTATGLALASAAGLIFGFGWATGVSDMASFRDWSTTWIRSRLPEMPALSEARKVANAAEDDATVSQLLLALGVANAERGSQVSETNGESEVS